MSETEARDSDDATPDATPDAASSGAPLEAHDTSTRRDPGGRDPGGRARRGCRAQLVASLAPDVRRSGRLLHRGRLRHRRPGCLRRSPGALRQRCHRPEAVPPRPRGPRHPDRAALPAQDAEVRAVHVPGHRQHGPRGRGDRRAGHLGDDPDRRLTLFSGPSQPRSRTPRGACAVLLFDTIEEVPHEDPSHPGRRGDGRSHPERLRRRQHHRTGRCAPGHRRWRLRPARREHVARPRARRRLGTHRLPADRRRSQPVDVLVVVPAVLAGRGSREPHRRDRTGRLDRHPGRPDDRDGRRAPGLHVLAGPRPRRRQRRGPAGVRRHLVRRLGERRGRPAGRLVDGHHAESGPGIRAELGADVRPAATEIRGGPPVDGPLGGPCPSPRSSCRW